MKNDLAEKVILKTLHSIDNELENILIDLLQNEHKCESKEIKYVLTSISVLVKNIKKECK